MIFFRSLNVLPLLLLSVVSFGGEKENSSANTEIEMAEFLPPKGKKCDLIEIFEFKSISGDPDIKAKAMSTEKKVGINKSGGESANYLLKIGVQRKVGGGLLPGSTIVHNYAAYFCFVPLSN